MTLYSSSLSNSAQLLVIAFLEKEGHDFYSIVFCDAGGGRPTAAPDVHMCSGS